MKVANASVRDMQKVIKSAEEKYRNDVMAIDKSIAKYRKFQSVLGVVEIISIVLAVVGFAMILGVAGSSDFESFYGVDIMSSGEAFAKAIIGVVFVGAVYPISLVTGRLCDCCDVTIKNLKKDKKECYSQLSYVKGAVGLLMRKMG
jgi:hypothetical protein